MLLLLLLLVSLLLLIHPLTNLRRSYRVANRYCHCPSHRDNGCYYELDRERWVMMMMMMLGESSSSPERCSEDHPRCRLLSSLHQGHHPAGLPHHCCGWYSTPLLRPLVPSSPSDEASSWREYCGRCLPFLLLGEQVSIKLPTTVWSTLGYRLFYVFAW